MDRKRWEREEVGGNNGEGRRGRGGGGGGGGEEEEEEEEEEWGKFISFHLVWAAPCLSNKVALGDWRICLKLNVQLRGLGCMQPVQMTTRCASAHRKRSRSAPEFKTELLISYSNEAGISLQHHGQRHSSSSSCFKTNQKRSSRCCAPGKVHRRV